MSPLPRPVIAEVAAAHDVHPADAGELEPLEGALDREVGHGDRGTNARLGPRLAVDEGMEGVGCLGAGQPAERDARRAGVRVSDETHGQLTGGEGADPVDLVGVLAAERAAADRDAGAVAVHDELLAREAVVAEGAAAAEVACAVQVEDVVGDAGGDPGQGRVQFLAQLLEHGPDEPVERLVVAGAGGVVE